jgi:hypothetical protein
MRQIQFTLRLDAETVDRLDELLPVIAVSGLDLGRIDVIKVALAQGLAAMEHTRRGPKRR